MTASGQVVTVSFANQSSAGAYSLMISGSVMDQASNSLSPTTISFTDVAIAVPTNYDFGSATSPVAAGYTGVVAAAFSPSLGYGWLNTSNTVGTLDTGITTFTSPDPSVTRDLNYTTNGTFAVNVPTNGLYDVTLTLGDARGFGYPQTISFGGVVTHSVTTGGSAPAVSTKTYVVGVTGNQLQVGVAAAQGGTYAVIDGLTLLPTARLHRYIHHAGQQRTVTPRESGYRHL